MTVFVLYENEAEHRQHVLAMQFLASDTRSSEEIIRPLYEKVLYELKKEATVKHYLTIIVSRRVKSMLKEEKAFPSLPS